MFKACTRFKKCHTSLQHKETEEVIVEHKSTYRRRIESGDENIYGATTRTGYGITLTVMSVLLTAVYSSDIYPLHDGMLITARNALKIKNAEWTVLVTLEQPQVKRAIQGQYKVLVDTIQQAVSTRGERK